MKIPNYYLFFKIKSWKLLILIDKLTKKDDNNSDSYEEKILAYKAEVYNETDSNEENSLKTKAKTTFLNYMRWKCRKWKAMNKIESTKMRQSILTMIENEDVVCKICAKNVVAKNIKDHSLLCKERFETIMKIKEKLEQLKNEFLVWIFEDRRKVSLEIIILT